MSRRCVVTSLLIQERPPLMTAAITRRCWNPPLRRDKKDGRGDTTFDPEPLLFLVASLFLLLLLLFFFFFFHFGRIYDHEALDYSEIKRGGWKGHWIRRRIRATEESVEEEIAKGGCFSSPSFFFSFNK